MSAVTLATVEPRTPQQALEEYTSSLLYRMQLTKGARFQAARRHQRRATGSLWSVIALSMYVFTVSAVLSIYDLSSLGTLEKELVISNIVMSAFIIAFSVLEAGKKHDLKAEMFLRCAQGIQELRDRIEFDLKMGNLKSETISASVEKYNELVHDFADNHSEADYRTFRINIGKHKDQKLYSVYHSCTYWLDCWCLMIFSVFIPPITFFFLFRQALL
jgi:SMODS and SLOG-associating 2TM effector domain family 5